MQAFELLAVLCLWPRMAGGHWLAGRLGGWRKGFWKEGCVESCSGLCVRPRTVLYTFMTEERTVFVRSSDIPSGGIHAAYKTPPRPGREENCSAGGGGDTEAHFPNPPPPPWPP